MVVAAVCLEGGVGGSRGLGACVGGVWCGCGGGEVDEGPSDIDVPDVSSTRVSAVRVVGRRSNRDGCTVGVRVVFLSFAVLCVCLCFCCGSITGACVLMLLLCYVLRFVLPHFALSCTSTFPPSVPPAFASPFHWQPCSLHVSACGRVSH